MTMSLTFVSFFCIILGWRHFGLCGSQFFHSEWTQSKDYWRTLCCDIRHV